MERVAVEAFRNISERWGIAVSERSVFLQIPEDVIERWFMAPAQARLEMPQLERISYMLGIFGALHILFDQTSADDWPNRNNVAFSNRRPLDRMLDGIDGLREVHRYVQHAAYVGW